MLNWVFLCLLAKAAFAAEYSTRAQPWEEDIRLPSDTYAVHYDLYMHPDLVTRFYYGRVVIAITSSSIRDHFIVHEKLLNITRTALFSIEGSNRVDVPVSNAFEYAPHEFWVVQTTTNVSAGNYELELDFDGYMDDKIIGFYYSEYRNDANETIPLATSKFQPTYARQGFPCFDEPSYRSTFNITLVRPSTNDYIGLSNMPVLSEVQNAPSFGLTEVTFEKSVSMVSYLVCFIVSDFVYLEEIVTNGLPLRVYAPADRVDNMQYAMDFAVATLPYYESVFDMPYPLPKLDNAAIPDYSSGATEHWGLVTYRESRIFYNPTTSSTQQYISMQAVIAHEFAHMWFGNLVTLMWWDDLWLNEGFASYIEYKGVNNYNPTTLDMYSEFVVDNIQDVFNMDSKTSSHPIILFVETPDEITAIFDDISYKKGASVLRMMEDFMGLKTQNLTYFQDGINNFLEKYAFQNVVSQDLYDELTMAWIESVPEGEKSDIGVIVDTWARQMGYPTVSVVRTAADTLTLTQERFLQDPNSINNVSESVYGYIWDVPISYKTSMDPTRRTDWLYREMPSLVLTIDPTDTWYKINVDQMGYYRVNYEEDNWAQMQLLLNTLSLSVIDRSSLYDDALSLAAGDLLDYNIAMDLTEALSQEDHHVPWTSAERKLKEMDYLLLETNVTQSFRVYLRELVGPLYNNIGWNDGASMMRSQLQSVIVDLASRAELSEALLEAGTYLQAWIDDIDYPLPIETKVDIYWWGMIDSGSLQNWDIMWERCMAENDATERSDLYYGLANAQDAQILARYINLAFDEDNVKSQDFLNILEDISRNPAGTELVWFWVRQNWTDLVDRYTLNDRSLGQLIPEITRYFATTEKLEEMEVFFTTYPEAGAGELYREQAYDQVEYNIYWVQSYSQVIMQWLNNRVKLREQSNIDFSIKKLK